MVLSPRDRCFNWLSKIGLPKWGLYLDQYLLFPREVRKSLREVSSDALFVFCDQALGPWVPLVADRAHIVHVHDLLALRSALGEFPENPVSVTGRIYQRYIRRGFRRARHFISISYKTRDDLHRFGCVTASISEVVHNGLAYPYSRIQADRALQILRSAGLPAPARGMLLHVGGGQWYKNLPGIVALYSQYAAQSREPAPLWIIGGTNSSLRVIEALREIPTSGDVQFFENIDNVVLQAIYSISRALLFPSLAEGFGWPLIEAQACGCPVITTDEAPMNEIAGSAARYLPRLLPGDDIVSWAQHGAELLNELLSMTGEERNELVKRGIAWTARFDADAAIDRYLSIYRQVQDRYLTEAASDIGSTGRA